MFLPKAQAAASADYQLTADDVRQWEAQHGAISPGTLVIANTGWHQRFTTPERYINKGKDGIMHFPGFHPEAARLLVERDVVGIAIDTLSLDHGAAKEYATHHVVLAAGKLQIENLANLGQLSTLRVEVIALPMKIAGGSGGPLRIIARLPGTTCRR